MTASAARDIAVWDPAVRLSHWTLAIAFAVTYITEDHWELLHVNAGYLIGALIAFRVLWGFIGPLHARFSDFVRPPTAVVSYLATALRGKAPRHIGHNPAGGVMVLALLACLTLTVVSGIALYGTTDFSGPLAGALRGELAADLLEGIHELGANLTLVLVALHLGGVIFTSLEHRENLVKAMLTGRKQETLQ